MNESKYIASSIVFYYIYLQCFMHFILHEIEYLPVVPIRIAYIRHNLLVLTLQIESDLPSIFRFYLLDT